MIFGCVQEADPTQTEDEGLLEGHCRGTSFVSVPFICNSQQN